MALWHLWEWHFSISWRWSLSRMTALLVWCFFTRLSWMFLHLRKGWKTSYEELNQAAADAFTDGTKLRVWSLEVFKRCTPLVVEYNMEYWWCIQVDVFVLLEFAGIWILGLDLGSFTCIRRTKALWSKSDSTAAATYQLKIPRPLLWSILETPWVQCWIEKMWPPGWDWELLEWGIKTV